MRKVTLTPYFIFLRLYQAAAGKGHEEARRILERAGRITRAEDLLDPLKRMPHQLR